MIVGGCLTGVLDGVPDATLFVLWREEYVELYKVDETGYREPGPETDRTDDDTDIRLEDRERLPVADEPETPRFIFAGGGARKRPEEALRFE